MPRGKKVDKQKKKDVITEEIKRDHEEFLKAFEKPTQIYRFIRARQLISPTFLHRTTLYMRERCSRTNARRKVFKVDDIFATMVNQDISTFSNVIENNHEELWLAILGFYDTPINEKNRKKKKSYKRLDVEIAVKKSLHAKRKSCEIQDSITSHSVVNVPVNPRSVFGSNIETYMHRKDAIVKIPCSSLAHFDDHFTSSFTIVLKVREDQSEEEDLNSEEVSEDDEISDEDNPDKKRRKVEEEDDPAGISLKNLTSGPRKRKTRIQAHDEDDSDGEKRRGTRLAKKNDGGAATPNIKERMMFIKPSPNLKRPVLFETELMCFDRDKECKLTDGEYEVVMKAVEKDNEASNETVGDKELKRNAQWEIFDSGKEIPLYSALSEPYLKFHLKWKNKIMNLEQAQQKISSVENLNSESISQKVDLPVNNIEYRKGKLQSNGKSQLNGTIELNGVNGVSGLGETQNSVIQYQFMYNNNTQMQTEARVDLFCPWCQLNCFTRYGLMKHLTLCHPRFLFTYSQLAKGAKIIVNLNQCYDGSFAGNPLNMFNQPGIAFGHRNPVRRIPSSDIIVYRPQRVYKTTTDLTELLEKENTESISMTQYRAGHRRLYFHSLTALPIKPCQFDYDSEGEGDPDWLTSHMKQMIDEFTDVNEGEKAIMKMWNIYIMENPLICDSEMEAMCKNFITDSLDKIIKFNLKRNLLLHVICLVDFGVIKSSSVKSIMQFFYEAEKNYLKQHKIAVTSPVKTSINEKEKLVKLGASPDFPEPDMLTTITKLKAVLLANKSQKK